MSTLKVEFLVSQDKKTTTCSNKKRIVAALNSNSVFDVSEKEIKYNKLIFPYMIKELTIGHSSNQCFHITIESQEINIEQFIKLINYLHKDFNKHFENKVQIVWNEIDTHFSTLAYPLIKRIENLMRKFLTQFFQINLGTEWVKRSVPQDITNRTDRQKREATSNYLYSTDFIDINVFLFQEYTRYEKHIIYAKMKNATKIEDLSEIHDMLPKSNWDRYFKGIVLIDEKEFEANWQELYKLRCQVAHNNSFNDRDFNQLQKLINKVEPIIDEFIKNAIKVHIPDDEKELIAIQSDINENTANAYNTGYTSANELLSDYKEPRYENLIGNFGVAIGVGLEQYQKFITNIANSETFKNQVRILASPEAQAYIKSLTVSKGLPHVYVNSNSSHLINSLARENHKNDSPTIKDEPNNQGNPEADNRDESAEDE